MAVASTSTPLSPKSQQGLNMVMPMPPPLLHTRSGNELYDRPQTPTTPGGNHGFTSPVQTPQGSPSKKQLPPGATDLPNVFENAMKLAPMSPTKSQPMSPTKQGLSVGSDNVSKDPFADGNNNHYARSESPTRQSNKENAPGGGMKFGKEQNHAALSRQEQYQPTESRKTITKGLTTEEMQKLQLPKLKRLANVTQLCKYMPFGPAIDDSDSFRLPRLLLRPPFVCPQPTIERGCLQIFVSRTPRDAQGRV